MAISEYGPNEFIRVIGDKRGQEEDLPITAQIKTLIPEGYDTGGKIVYIGGLTPETPSRDQSRLTQALLETGETQKAILVHQGLVPEKWQLMRAAIAMRVPINGVPRYEIIDGDKDITKEELESALRYLCNGTRTDIV